MTRLASLSLLGAALLTGCDANDALFDPNVARIDAATVAQAPAGGALLFVRLMTPFDTTDTEAASGPFPARLEAPSETVVTTTDGPFEGDALTVEVRLCAETCAESVAIGRATVAPDAWPGAERLVDVGGASVRLHYRRTSS